MSVLKIEIRVKNLPTKKLLVPHGFIGDFYETLKKEKDLINSSPKVEQEGMLPNLF